MSPEFRKVQTTAFPILALDNSPFFSFQTSISVTTSSAWFVRVTCTALPKISSPWALLPEPRPRRRSVQASLQSPAGLFLVVANKFTEVQRCLVSRHTCESGGKWVPHNHGPPEQHACTPDWGSAARQHEHTGRAPIRQSAASSGRDCPSCPRSDGGASRAGCSAPPTGCSWACHPWQEALRGLRECEEYRRLP